MRCDRHIWDTEDKEWCWKCEELTIEHNKRLYENKFCDNSIDRERRNNEIGKPLIKEQEEPR